MLIKTSKVPENEWLSVSEIATYFSIDKLTIYRDIQDGKIPCIKLRGVIRVPRSWLLEHISEFVKVDEGE